MRIIAGIHKNRRIDIPPSAKNLRPTSDFARQALFNILTHSDILPCDLSEASVADLCAGSGAFGLEALSRGAAHVTFVDEAGDHIRLIQAHLTKWKEEGRHTLLRADVTRLPMSVKPHQLIFLDPPYHSGIIPKCLPQLKEKGWVDTESIIITECDKDESYTLPEGMERLDQRRYGRAVIDWLRML
jgi:16S rRNA (guanine966-N2)-methyltransferase